MVQEQIGKSPAEQVTLQARNLKTPKEAATRNNQDLPPPLAPL